MAYIKPNSSCDCSMFCQNNSKHILMYAGYIKREQHHIIHPKQHHHNLLLKKQLEDLNQDICVQFFIKNIHYNHHKDLT